ncbi:LOW QUALITY PROTEIN: mediator of DNA damage checkpoint protein 1 [Oncorhynchus kisutch]|uniref:LOW QUALITY PROTEIN: mediator of DNA damage checkpoint protein 1 n=1 Tax=Oncorhynchus kisutch TaxID=8019 RepID=UPI0012DCB0CB|nr:LOW QUALITY PROTEIN: mediator of DNA damage checkpoint protein 1 [Oncorhynchus kisutch]
MEATQLIDDSILEESEEEDGEMRKGKRGEPLAKLRVLKNEHISETELPLYQGENVLGRNPNSCSLPLVAPSVSKQHTVISISMFRGNCCRGNVAGMETEALVWDLGSMNGTRKGRTKLTPHVRYALTDGECVVIADIPCQYVSVDQRGGQGHMQNPTNAHSGRGRRTGPDRKAQFRGSPSGQGLGRETGTSKTERLTEGRGVVGEMGAPLSTELGGKGKTRAIPLSLEQTPTKPESTLVPESESDSDGDREGRRDKRGKYFVSDSDSHVSSPTCSTFLSPTNKVIPEGEDDKPITPSAKNRPKKVVSFSEEESDMDGPRQQPRRRRAQVIVDDSEEEEEQGKEGTKALGEKEPGKRTRGKEDVSVVNQVSQAERDAPMVSTEDTVNMDSDTDVEGEEEMGLSAPVKSVKPPAVTEPPTTDSDPGQIHMDSDTDVEEGDTMDVDAKLMLTAADVERKPVDSVPVVQPTEIHLVSDTDVDDDVVVSDIATNVTSFVSDPAEKPDDPAPAVPPVEFHPDTDTDVEEEDTDTHSKTVPESDSSGIRTGIAGPQEILLDSDTDEEDKPFTPPSSSRTAELLNPPTSVGPAAAAPLEIRSDSDTDLEEDATQTMNLPPPNVATVMEDAGLASRQAVLPSPTTTTIDLRSQDSDANTDAEEERLEPNPPRGRPPAGMVPESDLSEPSDFRVDSDTEEDGPGEAGQGQTACRLREGAVGPGLLPLGGSPGPHQKCSTPLASSVQEEMETQAFFSPSDSFRHPALPPVLRPTAALSCSASDNQEDDDFVVAETQSFVLEAQNQGHQSSLPVEPTLDSTQPYGLEPSLGEDREEQPSRGSFQLGLSDSRDLSLQARDQASESPQASSSPDRDSDLEATQTYASGGGSEEPGPGQRSAVFGRNRQGDFVLEATQAYAAQPCSDTEEEDEEESPTTSNVATTETLPMSAYEEEEEGLVGAMPSTPGRRGRSGGVRERGEEEQETQTGDVLINQYLSTAQTLDMVQESDDEEEAKPDSPRGRGQPQEQTVDEEETQTVCSYLSTAETQPMFTAAAEDDDNEEEELKPPSPRRRGRSQRGRVEEEETQPSEFLTSSHISTAETQPMGTCDTEEEEEEDTKDKGRAQRERGKESEAGTSGVNSRGRRGEEEEESAEPPKTQTRGKGKAVNTAGGRGRRGKVLSEEGESEKEEEVEVIEQGRRGRKSVKQQKEGEKERLEREQREEEEGIEKQRQEQAEKERLQKEKVESERVMKEQQDRERMEQELKEQDDRLERERVEREETERMEREKKEETERMEREKEETERMEREKREETERMEREKREETERMEREKREETERMEREKREETERMETEKREETERMEREKREQEERERLERERKEREEQERLERENERLEREEKERIERKDKERKRLEKNKEEKERLDREIKERNLKEKLEREREKSEAEEKEKEIKERQAKEQGEKQTKKDNENEPKTSTRGRRAITRRTVMVPPTTEPQPEPDILSSQPEPVPESITRSRSNSVSSERSTSNIGTQGSRGRGGRKTTSTTESAPGPDNPIRNSTRRRTLVGTVVAPPAAVEVTVQDILSSEQFVARRTRSRSSSTNSHSSLNSEVSTGIAASVSSQSKGRGGGRRKTGTESVSPSNRQSEQPPALKPTARGRRSQKVEDDVPHPEINENADSQEAGGTTRGQKKTDKTNEPDPVVADEETTPAQVTEDSPTPRGNGRGRGRGGQKDNTPESTTTTAGGGKTQSEEGVGSKTGGKGRKRGLEEEEESSEFKVPRGKAKVQRGGRRRAAEEGEKEEKPASTPAKRGRASTAQVKKIAEEEKSMEGQSEKMEEEEAGTVQRKVRGRQSTVQIKKEEESVLDSNSVVMFSLHLLHLSLPQPWEYTDISLPQPWEYTDISLSLSHGSTLTSLSPSAMGLPPLFASLLPLFPLSLLLSSLSSPFLSSTPYPSLVQVPQTPTGKGRGKRRAPVESSPFAKTPRSSSASPLSSLSSPGTLGRARASTQSYKVLFTGVVDEEGGKVVSRLGGSLAKGVADMTHLVTDRIRRTIKFLCAVARGMPVVTTDWLDKCGKVGSFLPTDRYLVKDREQENKFSFCLEESLRTASTQPLLQGYEVHVTRSVLPEPAQMKDIIVCSGARFLSTMPSTQKAQARTLVISCGEDWSLCAPALSASLPVLSAEFLLTGILQQRVDLVTHVLSAPKPRAQPGAKGQASGRKRT